jgi:hypothetical protein
MIEPTWPEQKWTTEERQRLAAQLGQFSAEELRQILETAFNCDDTAFVAAELRGAVLGMAGRIEDRRKRSNH